jgi:hypothetical protein
VILKTPRLVAIEPDYVANISKKARYERKQSYQRGAGCLYSRCGPDREVLARFMAEWSRQIRRPWGRYSVSRFITEGWSYFRAATPTSTIALHPVLICDDYAYAAAPMYDKTSVPWAAKFMWFSLIDWLIAEGSVKWLDLGGGSGKTWRQLLSQPDRSYKWLYVSANDRRNASDARPWKVQVCRCGWRQLVVKVQPCKRCDSIAR